MTAEPSSDPKGGDHKARRALIDAALKLSADQGYALLTAEGIAREAGLSPRVFFEQFRNMQDFSLALVYEIGEAFRHIMREVRAHHALARDKSVVRASVESMIQYIERYPQLFRLLVAERAGSSALFRRAVRREMQRLVEDLEGDIEAELAYSGRQMVHVPLMADAVVTLILMGGAECLERPQSEWPELTERTITQLRVLLRGAEAMAAGWEPEVNPPQGG